MTNLRHNFDVLYELTKKELKVRYKSSVLGYLWSLLNPLAMAAVFYVAFRVIMKVQLADSRWPFALFLLTGLFPWQWLANSLTKSASVYVANSSLVRRVAFRRELLPLAAVLNDMLHFMISLPVIVVLLVAAGGRPSWSWLYGLPVLIAAQLLLVYGLSLLVASMNVLFRDLEHLITILLQVWFYVTPILYDMNTAAGISPKMAIAIRCNPMAPLVESYRRLILDGSAAPELWALSLAYGLAAAGLGVLVHRRLQWKFAEVL